MGQFLRIRSFTKQDNRKKRIRGKGKSIKYLLSNTLQEEERKTTKRVVNSLCWRSLERERRLQLLLSGRARGGCRGYTLPRANYL